MANEKGSGSVRSLGIAISNASPTAESTTAHVKAVLDLKVGKFNFHGVPVEMEKGKVPVVQYPWTTELVSIDEAARTKIEDEVIAKITEVLRNLKHGSAGLWKAAK